MKEIFKDDLKLHEKNQKQIQAQMKKLEKKITAHKESIHTYEKFLELMEKLPKNLDFRMGMQEIDTILKKVFLNFYIEDKKVLKTTLNSPFDKLETKKVSDGAR